MKRQKFYSANHYNIFLKAYDEAIDFYRTRKFKSDSAEEEEMLRSRFFQRLSLDNLLATYTAGEAVPALIPIPEDLVSKYEEWQVKLAQYEKSPDISPLAISD